MKVGAWFADRQLEFEARTVKAKVVVFYFRGWQGWAILSVIVFLGFVAGLMVSR